MRSRVLGPKKHIGIKYTFTYISAEVSSSSDSSASSSHCKFYSGKMILGSTISKTPNLPGERDHLTSENDVWLVGHSQAERETWQSPERGDACITTTVTLNSKHTQPSCRESSLTLPNGTWVFAGPSGGDGQSRWMTERDRQRRQITQEAVR